MEATEEFLRMMDSHRGRALIRLMTHLPREPRCAVCRAPFEGFGGWLMKPMGFSPSRKNPKLCERCFKIIPMGGQQMEVGVLFADIRDFTTFAEEKSPGDVAEHLNRFYAEAVEVLCRHAIVDKLVGDEVMALYLPGLFGSDTVGNMVRDAEKLLEAIGFGDGDPWVEVGVGLDFGTAYVGNVGAGDVKDFTAIGDVVNTAARLQSAAASGEIVMSARIGELAGGTLSGTVTRELELKGKSQPERAIVRSVYRRPTV